MTKWTFVGKVMSLLFNMLSRIVIAASKEQVYFNLIAEVTICSDCGTQENKLLHCFIVSPSIFHEMMGLDTMILVF